MKPMPASTRPALDSVAENAQALMQRHAKSFSWAARFLSPAARSDVRLLYAFARTADDLADESELGLLADRMSALRAMRLQYDQPSKSAAEPSLAGQVRDLLRHYGVDDAIVLHFLTSIEVDAGERCIEDEAQLMDFAFGVAGTVGLMLRPMLGAPAEASPFAMALGIAMQLSNIARDVVEDAQRGRCYVPASYGVSASELATPQNAQEREHAFAAIAHLLAQAERLYEFALSGVDQIAPQNQRAIQVALVLYRGIGRKILRLGPERYWHGRVHLSVVEKICLIAQVLMQGKPQPSGHAGRAWFEREFSALAHLPGFPRAWV